MNALTRRVIPFIGCSLTSLALAFGRALRPQVQLGKKAPSSMHSLLQACSMESSPVAAAAYSLPSSLHSKYHIHFQIQGLVERVNGGLLTNAIPVVFIPASTLSSAKSLLQTLESFRNDDVFCDDFMTGQVVVYGYGDEKIGGLSDPAILNLFQGVEELTVHKISEHLKQPLPPAGPYFLLGNQLHQAWKLYPDTLDSFSTTVIPGHTESYQILDEVTEDGLWRAVAVPSRLYSEQSKDKPLAGKRISIKDNFRLKGIKTTQSNRAFVNTYGPESETAAYLQKLIDMGAVVVGKTKLSAFASSEEATDQWIDFHPPFNPRADGYQSPSGSTSGGATSLAGYDWLDFSIGTDTSGSIRWPAAWNGLFGLRVTTDATSLTGVYRACRKMDTIGLLSRDLHSMHEVLQSTIEGTLRDIKSFPKEILYSTDFFPHENKIQQAIIDEYVATLESFLGVQRTEFSIADRWAQCPPPEANGKSIKEFLNKTAYNPFYWDGYHEFDKFREDHETKFKKKVYVGPYMRWKWEMGAVVTQEDVDRSLGEWAVYQKWFDETILKEDKLSGSTAVLILPCGTSTPKYRDDPNSSPGIVSAFSPNYIASMIGLPQLVLPIGQFPYNSRVSGHVEYLPAVGTLVGAKGSDLMLVKLAKAAFDQAKWPTEVKTGRLTFELGGGNRLVAPGREGDDSHL